MLDPSTDSSTHHQTIEHCSNQQDTFPDPPFSSLVNYPGWPGRMQHHLSANPHPERPFDSCKTSSHPTLVPHRESTRAKYLPSVQWPKWSRLAFIQQCVRHHLPTWWRHSGLPSINIRWKHPSSAHLPTSWPTSEDIGQLVNKLFGQFIFASTVAKYVNSHCHWPPDWLKIIFGWSKPGQEMPFAELDSLYHLILSSVTDIEKMQDVLMFLVVQPFWQPDLQLTQTTSLIKQFLFYRPGKINMILTALYSIMYVPSPGDKLCEPQFFHALLPDFLLDWSRSMDFFLNQGAAYAKLTGLAVKHISNLTESPLQNDQCMSLPSSSDFMDSMKMKMIFIGHFGCIASRLICPWSSLSNCAG